MLESQHGNVYCKNHDSLTLYQLMLIHEFVALYLKERVLK